MILSIDERLKALNKVAGALDAVNVNYDFIVVGKRRPDGINSNIKYQKNIIKQGELETHMDNAMVFLDLLRENQTGLSFRVFDSLAYQKKLITTNAAIIEYDFYNPQNIMVIDAENQIISLDFFSTTYQPLEDEIYYKYTLDNWVNTIFNL